MGSLFLHALGVALVVASLAYAAYLLGVSPHWIGVVVTFALGLGLIGIAKSRRS
jgi:hypothetical protein